MKRGKNMNKIIHSWILAFLFSLSAQAQDVGDFVPKQTDFKALFNQYRVSQPEIVPWAGWYWAYGYNGIACAENDVCDWKVSPAAKYDILFAQDTQANDWEKENHTCSQLPAAERAGCEGWWGHCNAWSAAALKDPEPRSSLKLQGKELSVADQKAWLTEMWMDSDSLFSGGTVKTEKTGPWVKNPRSDIGSRKDAYSGQSYYDSFWDVVPRAFFLIFTNYIGAMKVGVVIDRFTGDQVWNQPIGGYRILPIGAKDILAPETREGTTVYPVILRMKIYWAEDGVMPGHKTRILGLSQDGIRAGNDAIDVDVNSPGSLNAEIGGLRPDYGARLLTFRLYFDAPLKMKSPTEVESVGKMVGSGVWEHQLADAPVSVLDNTHPDFIWMPTKIISGEGNANPYIKAENVYKTLKSGGGPTPPPPPPSSSVYVSYQFLKSDFGMIASTFPSMMRDAVALALDRAGVPAAISVRDVAPGGLFTNYVDIRIKLLDGATPKQARAALEDAGYSVKASD